MRGQEALMGPEGRLSANYQKIAVEGVFDPTKLIILRGLDLTQIPDAGAIWTPQAQLSTAFPTSQGAGGVVTGYRAGEMGMRG